MLLLGPGVSAVREGASGVFSREASTISASSGALTWDYVSTGLETSPNLLGGGVSTTMGFSLFGVEFSDMCPDMSNPAQDRSPHFLGHADLSFHLGWSSLDGAGHQDGGAITRG